MDNFRRVGLWTDQVRLVKGWFKDTVPAAAVEKIAVLRLDGDLYESTIQVLEGFYPRLSVGGFCIIDDYGAMLSCRAAVEDFRRDHGVSEAIVDIDGKGVLWRKIVGSGDAGASSQGETGEFFQRRSPSSQRSDNEERTSLEWAARLGHKSLSTTEDTDLHGRGE